MKTKSRKRIVFEHIFTYFNFLNIVLAGFVFVSGQFRNATFLMVVFFNSLIGIVQEFKVKSLIDKLAVITATKARRVKDGDVVEVPVEELMVNDLIKVSIGDQIVADCVVTSVDGLEVNESLLTGESLPIHKKAGDVLYSGSHVVAGAGIGKITAVGDDSYANNLVKKAQKKRRANSEMQDSIKKIIKYVSFAIVPVGIALFCIQYFRVGENLSNSIVNTVAGMIGMIPEGLVLLTSISFILGVGRLARKKALVQEMESIEALARVNVLCLDKTGTITTGDLSVEKVVPLGGASKVSSEKIIATISYAFEDANATSLALQKYFADEQRFEIGETMPFSSRRKFMGVTSKEGKSFVLGAPDFLTDIKGVLEMAEDYEKRGYRVLLLASCDKLMDDAKKLEFVTPLSLVVLSDCIKEDAKAIFDFFAEQSVEIKVISGDNPATVSAVGVRAGIKKAEAYLDMTKFLDSFDIKINPEEFDDEHFPGEIKNRIIEAVEKYTVFGRVSPEAKQVLIKAIQTSGKIVGMVGDGVNDCLALKDADCAIAMANGADAAKQTAHIVLVDSDFSSMKQIVLEGRTIIANIERVSALYLTKTVYSLLLCILFIIIGKAYPFIPIQLTLISTVAIGIPSFLLALEKHSFVTTGGFMKHVLRISLPAAIVIVAGIVVIQLLISPLGLSDVMVRTLNLLLGGVVSLLVVVRVCRPFNRLRAIMCIALAGIFAIAVLFFPGFFGIC